MVAHKKNNSTNKKNKGKAAAKASSSSSGKKKKNKTAASAATTTKKAPVLSVLARLSKHGGNKSPTCQLVATLSGYTNIKSLDNKLRDLKKKGLVEAGEVSKTIKLTSKGWAEVDVSDLSCGSFTPEDCHGRCKETYKLTGKEAVVYDLLAADGCPHPRDAVMKQVGNFSNPKSFANLLGRIRKTGILEDVTGDGGVKMIRLSDSCFPMGRPANNKMTETTAVI